jgi:hypothetical protein
VEPQAGADVTQDVVGLLVQQIFAGIRDHLITSSELKMELLFPVSVYPQLSLRSCGMNSRLGMEADLDSFFDVASIRSELRQQITS